MKSKKAAYERSLQTEDKVSRKAWGFSFWLRRKPGGFLHLDGSLKKASCVKAGSIRYVWVGSRNLLIIYPLETRSNHCNYWICGTFYGILPVYERCLDP